MPTKHSGTQRLATIHTLCFDHNQCVMGDRVFVNKWCMVSVLTGPLRVKCFKRMNIALKNLSKARVTSKHLIGKLKGHFPWLRAMRKVIISLLNNSGFAMLSSLSPFSCHLIFLNSRSSTCLLCQILSSKCVSLCLLFSSMKVCGMAEFSSTRQLLSLIIIILID